MNSNLKSWIGLVAIAIAGASARPASAAEYSVMGIDWAPFTMGGPSGLTGIGVEIADELAKRTGSRVVSKEQASWARIFDASDKPNILVALLTRTPEREPKFHWIGKMADDRNCFTTRRDKPAVSSIDEAKKVRMVGVNAGGAAEKTLRDGGITNLEVVPQNSLNLRKLAAGRIDAWYTSALIAAYTVKKEGLEPDDFVCSGEVKWSSYWVAATLATPASEVEALKKAYKELEDKGAIKRIAAKYE